MQKIGGIKIIIDGQVYRCWTFKLNFAKNTITINNPDGKNVRHDVRDWHSFSAHAVLVQDVDQYMAEQALSRVPHKMPKPKPTSEEKIMQNFVDCVEDDDGKLHIILADIRKTEGKDLETMIDILGIDPNAEIVIEQSNENDHRYDENDDDVIDDSDELLDDDEGDEDGPNKYRIFEDDDQEP